MWCYLAHRSFAQVVEDAQAAAKAPKARGGAIAGKRASYNWNAAANAVADHGPGGKVVKFEMAEVRR